MNANLRNCLIEKLGAYVGNTKSFNIGNAEEQHTTIAIEM